MNQKNKGFTLVEVLIAMTVLAIIVVPLLRAFSTSANVNAKAGRLMDANNISQNIMEELKAEGLGAIAESGALGAYMFEKVNLRGDDEDANRVRYANTEELVVDGTSYIAEIALTVNEFGQKNLAKLNSMNEENCAYYVQPEDMDQKAAEEFQVRNATYAYGPDVSQKDSNYFLEHMSREILINVSADAVDVVYNYTIPEGFTTEADRTYTVKTRIYDEALSEETLQAVSLCFYPFPYYEEGNSFITINNTYKDIELYLIEQEVEEGFQKEKIQIAQKDTAGSSYTTSIYTNLKNEDFASIDSDCTIQYGDLDNKTSTDVLYDVVISIYRPQTTTGVEYHMREPIGTYEGTFMAN